MGDALTSNRSGYVWKIRKCACGSYLCYAALSAIQKLDIECIWPAHGDVPAGKELIAETKRLFENWAKGRSGKAGEKKGSVFGKTCRLYGSETNMTLAYNPRRLEEIHEFMLEHEGRME